MLDRLLKQASSVAIGGHIRPDGDCVGSCMGLYQYIRDNYKDIETDVYLEEIPNSYRFIKATEDIRHEIPEGKIYDLFICLDCGDAQRLGFSGELFEIAKHTLCVDHHVTNGSFAEENYVEPDASSTSELIYNLIPQEKITKEIAESLFMGIAHDTGVFQYSCTSPSTFRAAAVLQEKGIDVEKLVNKTFYEKTYHQNQVLGRALLESILFLDGKCIASAISMKDMEFYQVKPKHLDGIVSQLKMTKGVEVAIFMYELEPGVYKVSLRSVNQVDVGKVAQYFGGGGHRKAAGCTMPGTVHDVLNNLTRQLELQL
ncbi:DHH family phosphoesterase [Sporofaciens sp. SGI.106]|uniref:DHH family phosphoesterase n=1 Tax=Sporofaciens sp. SGI.106 TaxID=3420568 RepID=UPI002A9909BC|nr:bifunctional oligoribonuclease/PAP phosphatase NrnA [Lachnoclostridium sp.]